VARLAADGECACGEFLSLGSKTNLSYHLAKLREAGVVRVRQDGVFRHLSLRWEDLEARFPGLMQSLLAAAKRDRVGAPKRKAVRA
jgi:DNA-binding transcriptional ArsR family regulator